MPKALHPYEVLRRPIVTEKSTMLAGHGKYVFEVSRHANKPQIKEAVEKAFSVTVMDVNTLIVRGRRKKNRAGRPGSGPRADLEKGDGHAEVRRPDHTLRRRIGTAMPIKSYKPTSPGRRNASGHSFEEITKKPPEKHLVVHTKRAAGRSAGKISVRHRGGGHKRLLRIVDFKRDKFGVPGRIAAIEYDPGRSARLALVFYVDGEKRYIVAPAGLKVGATIISADNAPILRSATRCRCRASRPARASTTSRCSRARRPARTVRRYGDPVDGARPGLRAAAHAVGRDAPGAGAVPRDDWRRRQLRTQPDQARQGRAHAAPRAPPAGARFGDEPGRPPARRWRGQGLGRHAGPKTPWGKPALGYRTRNNKRTDKYIVRRRGKGRR